MVLNRVNEFVVYWIMEVHTENKLISFSYLTSVVLIAYRHSLYLLKFLFMCHWELFEPINVICTVLLDGRHRKHHAR